MLASGVCIVVREEDTLIWSMPVWIMCKLSGIPVRLQKSEKTVTSSQFVRHNLPPLINIDGIDVSELMAIIETINETYPDNKIWPKLAIDRAIARDICAEIVKICSGSSALVLNLSELKICVDVDFLDRVALLVQNPFQWGSCFFYESSAIYAVATLLLITDISGVDLFTVTKFLKQNKNPVLLGDWLDNPLVVSRDKYFSKFIAKYS